VNAYSVISHRQDKPTCQDKQEVTNAAGAEWAEAWKPLCLGAQKGSLSKQPTANDVKRLEDRILYMRQYENTTVVSYLKMVKQRTVNAPPPHASPLRPDVIQAPVILPAPTSG
jgi:hypothetical protein